MWRRFPGRCRDVKERIRGLVTDVQLLVGASAPALPEVGIPKAGTGNCDDRSARNWSISARRRATSASKPGWEPELPVVWLLGTLLLDIPRIINTIDSGQMAMSSKGKTRPNRCGSTASTLTATTANPMITLRLKQHLIVRCLPVGKLIQRGTSPTLAPAPSSDTTTIACRSRTSKSDGKADCRRALGHPHRRDDRVGSSHPARRS